MACVLCSTWPLFFAMVAWGIGSDDQLRGPHRVASGPSPAFSVRDRSISSEAPLCISSFRDAESVGI
jgi:hypothetical protein